MCMTKIIRNIKKFVYHLFLETKKNSKEGDEDDGSTFSDGIQSNLKIKKMKVFLVTVYKAT